MCHYTRRQLLATVAAGQTALSAGCIDTGAKSEHVEDIEIICDAPLPEPTGSGGAWPTYHHDLQNTGHAPNVAGPSGCPEVQWRADVDALSDSRYYAIPTGRMTYDGSVFYVSGSHGGMFAFSPQSGGVQLNHPGEYQSPRTPVHRNGATYRANGRYIQKFERQKRVRNIDLSIHSDDEFAREEDKRLHIDGSDAFVAQLDGRFYAVNLETGSIRWSFSSSGIDPEAMDERPDSTFGEYYAAGSFEQPPAVTRERVFAGSWDTTLYAFDRQSGRVIWQQAFDYEFDNCAPVVRHGSVFVTDGATLRCLDPETGLVKWERTEGVFGPQPVLTDSELIIAHGRDRLFLKAMDYETGEDLWRRELQQEPVGLKVAGGVIYTLAGNDIAFDRSDGTRLLRVDGFVQGPPCVGGGAITFPKPDRIRGIH